MKKIYETVSFMARGSNSKLICSLFWTHFPKSLLFTRECKWFILVIMARSCSLSIHWDWGKVKGKKKNVGGEKHGTKPPPSLPPHSSTPSFSLLYWRVYKSCSWLEFSLLTVLYTYKYIYIYKYIPFFQPCRHKQKFSLMIQTHGHFLFGLFVVQSLFLFIGWIFSLDTSSVKENKKRSVCKKKKLKLKKAFFSFLLKCI